MDPIYTRGLEQQAQLAQQAEVQAAQDAFPVSVHLLPEELKLGPGAQPAGQLAVQSAGQLAALPAASVLLLQNVLPQPPGC